MSREVEYRRYAAALVNLAQRAAAAADRIRLLVMAEAWLTLANKLGRLTKPRASGSASSSARAETPDQPWPE